MLLIKEFPSAKRDESSNVSLCRGAGGLSPDKTEVFPLGADLLGGLSLFGERELTTWRFKGFSRLGGEVPDPFFRSTPMKRVRYPIRGNRVLTRCEIRQPPCWLIDDARSKDNYERQR